MNGIQMAKARVSIVSANDYDCPQIHTALEAGLELIGGLEGLIKPGSRVLVKINHLPSATPAERGKSPTPFLRCWNLPDTVPILSSQRDSTS